MNSDYDSLLQKSSAKHFVLKTSAAEDPSNSLLGQIKQQLNATKDRISRLTQKHGMAKWKAHTAFTHSMKKLPKILADQLAADSICTQAYCKFAEIMLEYPQLVNSINCANEEDSGPAAERRSFHLCESPGGFVSALSHVLDKRHNWDWLMNSLNPYHEYNKASEMLCDDTLIVDNSDKMVFGEDDTGNIFAWTDEFVEKLRNKWKLYLITADGSQDCTDNPKNQELTVAPLIAQEVNIALGCLQKEGNLVLKMFTFFEPDTHNILARLLTNFERVEVFKPASSKPGNSEVYLVSQLKKISDCAAYFANHQINWINFNLSTCNYLSAIQGVCGAEIDRKKIQWIIQSTITHSLFCTASLLLKHGCERVSDLCQVRDLPNTSSMDSLNCWQLTKGQWIDLLIEIFQQNQPLIHSSSAKKARIEDENPDQ
uniref:Cap-specific mRNA (nucleoside-2'-O-)-methyltransferase 2 n=1 Tax=Ditylenchus dipsaci TaxID=166011 RepID=A0A915E6Q4_9BILA